MQYIFSPGAIFDEHPSGASHQLATVEGRAAAAGGALFCLDGLSAAMRGEELRSGIGGHRPPRSTPAPPRDAVPAVARPDEPPSPKHDLFFSRYIILCFRFRRRAFTAR